ncbi:glycoside hydrolase family 3 protein [Mycobacterium sp. KBS0706]|uniref:glycoside hydrolase family 3 protein n=1 Tax=Mycobacterium sp. KBS0706 TaxID=2578109 RepID=UPI00110FDCF8|nr:glycoside hydrolase family 3 N-terminal domain-containing protein [Mycobacterium sp. KBS0706]TSD86216.1 glycoside hydrolase family 3 protein [Mycobacterium sp. KBS0706]
MPLSRTWPAVAILGLGGWLATGPAIADAAPALESRSAPILSERGVQYRDLNRNGRLDPYEDRRLPPAVRAQDLVWRMTLEEKAGQMLHATPASTATGDGWTAESLAALIGGRHVGAMISRLAGTAQAQALAANQAQAVAEQTRLGIPVMLASDPRNHFQYVPGASVANTAFSQWPETTGLAAIGDPRLVRRFGDIARQEYEAIGLRMTLSPQADLSTEPRWPRINGTFGEDPDLASRLVEAYVAGFQNGERGLNRGSVVAVVKHWVGYGAAVDGFDGHNHYGQDLTFPAGRFQDHVRAFRGAFAADVAGVMPTYSVPPSGLTLFGRPLERVGAGFSRQLLTDLLRGRYGFDGLILSDWAITQDCDANCRDGWPDGQAPGFAGFGTPWGMEQATVQQRFVKAIDAGIDQFGGTSDDPAPIVQAVHDGQVSERRLDQSVVRILVQKFALGLFDNPYVDAAAAGRIAGNARFTAEGKAAQQASLVLLENKTAAMRGAGRGRPMLPLNPSLKRVWLHNVDAAAVRARGFTVVDDPAQADFALVRTATPYEILHPNYTFGSRQHEGRLDFRDGDSDYEAVKRASAAAPTIVTVYLDRPAVLANVRDRATALLGNFGITDDALLDVLQGKARPRGRLPFELPSSMAAVLAQASDAPYDSRAPLYRFGAGLSY